jgi:hypothetical protein
MVSSSAFVRGAGTGETSTPELTNQHHRRRRPLPVPDTFHDGRWIPHANLRVYDIELCITFAFGWLQLPVRSAKTVARQGSPEESLASVPEAFPALVANRPLEMWLWRTIAAQS